MTEAFKIANKIFVDILFNFNIECFYIFDCNEKQGLLIIYKSLNMNNDKFIEILSPIQLEKVILWSINRIKYSKNEIIPMFSKVLSLLQDESNKDITVNTHNKKPRNKLFNCCFR